MHRYDHRHDLAATRRAAEVGESPKDKELDRFLLGKDNRFRFELFDSIPPYGYAGDKIAFATQMTTASLEAIARKLSAVSGRKTLIWVTDSIGTMGYFMMDDVDPILKGWRGEAGADLPAMPSWQNRTDLEQMIRLMNNARVAVYTVDARGLETERLGFRTNPNGTSMDSPTAPVDDLIGRIPVPNGAMIEIAERTGGRAFYNRNDLETGIRRALDDSRFTYAIAYAPDHNKWKGEWRKIQLKVDRPGVTALARDGYFALPDPRPIPKKNRVEFLSEIAASPIDSAQLPLRVHISVPPKTADTILATVYVPPQSLATLLAPKANGRTAAHFEIMFMQIGAKDKLLDATRKQVDGELTPREYAATPKGCWTLPVRLPIKPGAQLLCVILHDEASDEVGSIRIPLTGPESALNVR
jgi:VWFA-related protein